MNFVINFIWCVGYALGICKDDSDMAEQDAGKYTRRDLLN